MVRIRWFLLVMVVLLAIPFANAATGCYMSTSAPLVPGWQAAAKISDQGHFTDDMASTYPYTLYCPDGWVLDSGSPSFKFSPRNPPLVNGSGHVGVIGGTTSFPSNFSLGFQSPCVARPAGTCTIEEACVFKLGDPDNSQVADCVAANRPFNNNFAYDLCCRSTEVCFNGVDDDEDGAIDCADHDCNNFNAGTGPEECTGSPYNTSGCIVGYNTTSNETIYDPECQGQAPPPAENLNFYCGYGAFDDPNNPPGTPGVCCPVGFYPFYSIALSRWQCLPTTECGLAGPPAELCYYDFDSQTTNWLSAPYNGGAEWCHSVVPNLQSPGIIPEQSTGCCLIQRSGSWDYYFDVDNVKIWG